MKRAQVTDAKAGAQHYRRVMAAFDGALALKAGERAEFLDRRCGDDSVVRREVEAMLAQAESTGAALEAGGGMEAMLRAGGAPAAVGGLAPSTPHLLAGQYRILRIIGEGGMGIVYEAEQAIPRRTVALKAIRSAFASRQMLKRFEHEAHILGRLQHPGIAQIYEAGAAVSDRSDQAFFAMEFVDGPSLTDHVEQQKLTLRERIELMARVCDAVQHAHERGVIHRDLKPSNILVDRSGQPKILDFGVARLADADSGDSVARTREGQLVGTLPYMSPEQVGGETNAVDTRSDVYALGVLLFEVLTGSLPHPVRDRTLPQMLIVIQNEAAPRLSDHDRAFRGDLDSIAAMALAKDKRRRFASAAELGADLRRYLDGDAVRAKQDSAIYVLRKQVHRHRFAAAAIAASVIALIAFAIYNDVRADRETVAKHTALSALAEADLQRERADENAHELADALRSSNIERGRLLGVSGNLRGAEELIWNEHLARPTPQSHWALWDLYSRFPCARTFGGSTDSVLALVLSPDGQSLATGAHDKLVRVWDLASGRARAELGGHGGMVSSVAYGPQSNRLYSASMDGTIKAWDLDQRKELWSLKVGDGDLAALACSKDGRKAAVVDRDGVMHIVDLETQRVAAMFRDPSHGPACIAFDADGKLLVSGGGDAVLRVWDVATGAVKEEIHGHADAITGLCFAPDGRRLASGSSDGVIQLREWEGRQLEATLATDNSTLRSLAFDADGTHLLATGSRDIEVWDLAREKGPPTKTVIQQPSFAAQFGPNGRSILAGASGGPIRVWELDAGAAQSSIDMAFEREHVVALSHNGRWAAGCEKDDTIRLWEIATKSFTGKFIGHAAPARSLSFDADGRRLVSAAWDNVVKVWNVADRSCVLTLERQGALVNGVRFSPDGRTIGVASSDGTVRIFDAESGAFVRELAAGLGDAQRLAFSPDGERIATTHRGRTIQIWDARSGAALERFEAPTAPWSIAFVPRSPLLVVGAWNGALQVWNVAEKKLVRTLSGHAQLVNSLSIASAALIASASADGTLKLWDSSTDVCLETIDAHLGPAENVLLSDDGRTLTAVYADGSLRRWDLSYFDRHIEGNAAFQAARRDAETAIVSPTPSTEASSADARR